MLHREFSPLCKKNLWKKITLMRQISSVYTMHEFGKVFYGNKMIKFGKVFYGNKMIPGYF